MSCSLKVIEVQRKCKNGNKALISNAERKIIKASYHKNHNSRSISLPLEEILPPSIGESLILNLFDVKDLENISQKTDFTVHMVCCFEVLLIANLLVVDPVLVGVGRLLGLLFLFRLLLLFLCLALSGTGGGV